MNTTIEKTLHILTSHADKIGHLTPFYLFNKTILEDNIGSFNEAFKSLFDRFQLSYSVKTNYASPILRTAVNNGLFLEVVSPFELEIARFFTPFSNIVYNGVVHDKVGKFFVATQGGIVNVENFTELAEIDQYASQFERPVNVGVRVRLQGFQHSRFGIEMNQQTIEKLKTYSNLRIVGLHCHTFKSRDLESWKAKASQMAIYAYMLQADYIDFGSNIYGTMNEDMAVQFNCRIPTFKEYAEVIREQMDKVYKGEKLPLIILEPGTPIIANAQSYIVSVKDIKEYADGDVCTVDGKRLDISVFGESSKSFPVYVINTGKNQAKHLRADICGCTCLESDILAKRYDGNIAIGDIVAIDNIGNYSNSTAPAFITEKPRVISIDEII